MSRPALPGTRTGDQSVYAGRTLLGFVRGSTAGAYAYSAAGEAIGAYADKRAAVAALTRLAQARVSTPEAGHAEAR